MKRPELRTTTFSEIVNDNTKKIFVRFRDTVNRMDKQHELFEIGFCISTSLKPSRIYVGTKNEINTFSRCSRDGMRNIKYVVHLHPYPVSERQIIKEGNLTPYFSFYDLLASESHGYYPCLVYRVIHDEVRNGKSYWYNDYYIKCAFFLPDRMTLIREYKENIADFRDKNLQEWSLEKPYEDRLKISRHNINIDKEAANRIIAFEKRYKIKQRKLFSCKYYTTINPLFIG